LLIGILDRGVLLALKSLEISPLIVPVTNTLPKLMLVAFVPLLKWRTKTRESTMQPRKRLNT
jgi:hypothetical protein